MDGGRDETPSLVLIILSLACLGFFGYLGFLAYLASTPKPFTYRTLVKYSETGSIREVIEKYEPS